MDVSAYTIGWICTLSLEMAVAVSMLDDIYYDAPLPKDPRDHNEYRLGRIGPHHIVITCFPEGTSGVTSAAVGQNGRLILASDFGCDLAKIMLGTSTSSFSSATSTLILCFIVI